MVIRTKAENKRLLNSLERSSYTLRQVFQKWLTAHSLWMTYSRFYMNMTRDNQRENILNYLHYPLYENIRGKSLQQSMSEF